MKYLYFVGFIATIFFANYLIGNVGYFCNPICVIPVWIGVYAPSGVLAVGLGFTLRDLVQRHLGLKWTLLAILLGALFSVWLNPFLALASGSAFLFSELMDLGVYTPLQKNHFMLAVISSNIIGLIADSIVFLLLAFGSLQFLEGQILGKLWMTLLAIPIVWYIRQKEVKA